jgi:Fe-S-cluster containining protein
MVPYASHADAEKIGPGIVERTVLAAQKQEAFKTSADVVFYSCRYQTADNRCGVWEDRPQFCRDYPDTPFVVMAPGCAFEGWAKNCKEKFYAMKAEVAQLKAMKQELDQLKSIQSLSGLQELPNAEKEGVHEPSGTQNRVAGSDPYPQIDALFRASGNTDNLSLVLSLTRLYVGSPMNAVFFIR